jgi:hypothetical protein
MCGGGVVLSCENDKLIIVPYFYSLENIVPQKYVMGSSMAYSSICSLFIPVLFSINPHQRTVYVHSALQYVFL